MSSFMGLPQLSHQDWLENAARQVDKQLQDDRSYQDLSDQLKVPIHSKNRQKENRLYLSGQISLLNDSLFYDTISFNSCYLMLTAFCFSTLENPIYFRSA